MQRKIDSPQTFGTDWQIQGGPVLLITRLITPIDRRTKVRNSVGYKLYITLLLGFITPFIGLINPFIRPMTPFITGFPGSTLRLQVGRSSQPLDAFEARPLMEGALRSIVVLR